MIMANFNSTNDDLQVFHKPLDTKNVYSTQQINTVTFINL